MADNTTTAATELDNPRLTNLLESDEWHTRLDALYKANADDRDDGYATGALVSITEIEDYDEYGAEFRLKGPDGRFYTLDFLAYIERDGVLIAQFSGIESDTAHPRSSVVALEDGVSAEDAVVLAFHRAVQGGINHNLYNNPDFQELISAKNQEIEDVGVGGLGIFVKMKDGVKYSIGIIEAEDKLLEEWWPEGEPSFHTIEEWEEWSKENPRPGFLDIVEWVVKNPRAGRESEL